MYLGRKINPEDPLFEANRAAFSKKSLELSELRSKIFGSRNAASTKKLRERGKLPVEERVALLLDPGSAFLELGALAGYNCYDDVPPGAGIVTGVGSVSDIRCMIIANDPSVKGGTYFPLTVKKHLRAQEIAEIHRLPCIYLVDSGGAFLPLQDQVFPDRFNFGRIFFNQARLSSLGIPQISVVLGSCTAGGAYVPAMSDQAIIVRNQGTVFLGGPPLVKAATGEIVTAEELGGGELHSTVSGVTDLLAEDEESALKMARSAIRNSNTAPLTPLTRQPSIPPRFAVQEIESLIPSDRKKTFPMREVLARLLDDSELDEFKPLFGTTLICGFARIDGYLIGVIANDGILFSEAAQKGAHFIQLCNQRAIPIVFFQDIVGFMVGKDYERAGIAKHGAKLVNAVACSQVPLYTVIVGNSFGAGNYAMCGRAYDPRFLFCWPNARVGVMGPEQASSVLVEVKKESAKISGKEWGEDQAIEYQSEIERQFTEQTDVFFGSARLWDDGVIEPRETRTALSLALALASKPEQLKTGYGVFRM